MRADPCMECGKPLSGRSFKHCSVECARSARRRQDRGKSRRRMVAA